MYVDDETRKDLETLVEAQGTLPVGMPAQRAPHGLPEPIYEGPDWHSRHENLWREMLAPLVGTRCRVLEIGSYEGRSARWLLDNVLTNKHASLVCVDTFGMYSESYDLEGARREERFDHNTGFTEYSSKRQIEKYIGTSVNILPTIADDSCRFDFIYIDGSHEAPDVLFDAVLSFELLKVGGLMCFDDFLWSPGELDGGVHAPQIAIGAFCAINVERLKVLHKGVQVWIKRVK